MHQEDFCQVLGVLPEMKYEQEGGPGFADCFRLVQEWSAEPILDSLNLLKWALFNFLIGNADAHAKNLSFLYGAGSVPRDPRVPVSGLGVKRLSVLERNGLVQRLEDGRWRVPDDLVERMRGLSKERGLHHQVQVRLEAPVRVPVRVPTLERKP